MSEFDVERPEIFLRPTDEPRPHPRVSAAVPIILVMLAMLGGLAAYKLLNISAVGGAAPGPELAELGERLESIEQRLDQLEKSRKAFAVQASMAVAKQQAKTANPGSAAAAAPASYDVSTPAPKPQPDSSPAVLSSVDSGTVNQIDLSSSPPDVLPVQETWQATADRLGNVVGELTSQRDEIERNRENLDRLAERFGRNSQSFRLQRGSRRQQVGPVWLGLQSTDTKNQRYTLRLLVDDKSIELRDRALHEAIQFYASDGKASVELVVSEIRKDGVAGRLTLANQH